MIKLKCKWETRRSICHIFDRGLISLIYKTSINKMNNNKVVPVIKLVKKLFSSMPQQYQLSGYHVEAMAVEFFSTYNGRNTLYDMTKHYLDASIKRVLRPITDITGQSHLIDSDLGAIDSLKRQHISHHIKDIAGRFSGSDAVSVTKELFGGPTE